MSRDTKAIEIIFPMKVHVNQKASKLIIEAIDIICDENCPEGHVMWLFGHGGKPTYIPLTAEEEKKRGAEYDMDVNFFEIACRRKHPGE